jgi:methyl-accepting chemotaxis protein
MEEKYDRKLLLSLPRQIFLTTDLITYVIIIPFTTVLAYLLIDIHGMRAVIYFIVVLALIGISLIVTIVSYRKIYTPIMNYFRAVLDGRGVIDAEFSIAKKIFFSISRKRGIEALITWCVLMPIAVTFVILFYNPTLKAIVIIISLFFINSMAMYSLYYLMIEYFTRRIARTGIFSRRAEGEEKMKTRMSTSLSLVVIALVAVFCGLMVPIAFNIMNDAMHRDRIEQMKTAVILISGWTEEIFNSNAKNPARLKTDLRRALYGVRREGGYAVVLDNGGNIIAHPDDAMVSRNAEEFAWGPGVLWENKCFDFRDSMGELMIACSALNGKHGFRVAYMTSRAEIDGAGRNVALFMLAFTAGCLALIGFGIYRLVANRLSPVEECRTVILETGRGNLHQNVISYSTDEPGSILLTMSGFLGDLKSIVANTQKVSGDLASASLEMAATAESFSTNAQNQASTAEEVSATAEEVSAGVDKIAYDAQQQYEGINQLLSQIRDLDRSISETAVMIRETADLSSQISLKAREGEQSMAGMNSAMTRITQSSDEMSGIVKIINDISDQINLLSLNAAIEAARAGDAGRGFAVVADEISKLADQTASSIKDIDRLIKANTEQIQNGMAYIGNATRNIGSIIEGVAAITSRMGALTENIKHQEAIKDSVTSEGDSAQERSDQIRVATDEQKRAMEEIVQSITRINELTQSIAAGTEQMTANLKGIERMAETLKENIEYFKTN